MLYLQSAVVMMDCLTVLSITSHTHKHNNNEANIITITMVGLHMLQIIPALHCRHGTDMENVATLPAPREANVQNKITNPGPGRS